MLLIWFRKRKNLNIWVCIDICNKTFVYLTCLHQNILDLCYNDDRQLSPQWSYKMKILFTLLYSAHYKGYIASVLQITVFVLITIHSKNLIVASRSSINKPDWHVAPTLPKAFEGETNPITIVIPELSVLILLEYFSWCRHERSHRSCQTRTTS